MPIEIIKLNRDFVFGFRATGRIESEEIDEIAAAIRKTRREHRRLRMYAEIESGWRMGPKAWVKDFLHGLRNAFGFEAAAVVTDQRPIAGMVRMAGLLPGFKARSFPTADREEAREWITSEDLSRPEQGTD